MIREAHEAGLYTIVSTNSQAMTPELAEALVQSGLDRIIISMDGLSEASYNAYRIGGSLEKTKSALQYLRAAKNQSPKTNHQSPITNQNLFSTRTFSPSATILIWISLSISTGSPSIWNGATSSRSRVISFARIVSMK